jgi:endonuclease/exonuclease/phosphatase (EEP) superfamily protein YafD
MYAQVEERQLRQLAETVQAQPTDSIVMVVGDFNIPRGSGLYRDFLVHSGLKDLLAGDTRPTLRIPFEAASRLSLPIDYILVRTPDKHSLNIDCDLCLSGKYTISNRQQGYLSDHHGIEVRITQS